MTCTQEENISDNPLAEFQSPFHVDEASCDEEYFYVDIASRGVTIQIKIEAEGVIVDAWPLGVFYEPVATMTVFSGDLPNAR